MDPGNREVKKAKLESDDPCTLRVSRNTQAVLQTIQERSGTKDIEKVILNLLEHKEYTEYCQQFLPQRRSVCLRLPFQIRLQVISFIPKIELKFVVNHRFGDFITFKSCQTGRLSTDRMAIFKEYFGYFQEDKFRKVFLIFKRVAIKAETFDRLCLHQMLPSKGILSSVRLYNGVIGDRNEKFVEMFPKVLRNGGQYGLPCLVLNSVMLHSVGSFVEFLETFGKTLKRFKISSFSFPNNARGGNGQEFNLTLQFFEKLKNLRSITVLGCQNVPPMCVKWVLESPNAFKIALGGNQLTAFPRIEGRNKSLQYLFVQNNPQLSPTIDETVFPNLRIINVSSTAITLMGFVELLRHPRLRKILASRLDLNSENDRDMVNFYTNGPEFCKLVSAAEIINLNRSVLPTNFFKLLVICKNLATLHLAKANITDEMISYLPTHVLTNLEIVSVAWNRDLRLPGFSHLLTLPSLVKFVSPQHVLSKEIVCKILENKTIRRLSLRSKTFNPFADPEVRNLFLKYDRLEYLNVTKQEIPIELVGMIKFRLQNIKEFKYTIKVTGKNPRSRLVDYYWKRPTTLRLIQPEIIDSLFE